MQRGVRFPRRRGFRRCACVARRDAAACAPAEGARAWILDNRELFRLSPTSVADLELVNAAEAIVGDLPTFTAVSIGWHEDVQDARDDIAAAIARVRSSHPSRDGSSRLLLDLSDGRSVEAVLLRALDKDPERRFRTAGEMADALEGVRLSATRVVVSGQVDRLRTRIIELDELR